MKKIIRLAMLVGAATCVFSFFGCRNKHILDGPGMVNDLSWKAFTLSRSDSVSYYNFYFKVERREDGCFLTGECQSEDGRTYEEEEGIRLSGNSMQYLRSLYLGDLPELVDSPPPEDLIILDESSIKLTVTYPDGKTQKKQISGELSMELYRHFVKCFQ